MDQISASLASISSREVSLLETVASIYDQVDKLYVYLNDYKKIPDFLNQKKIQVILGALHGDRGDSGKFYPLTSAQGYLFTLDDDIIYPHNYIKNMCDKINYYNRKNIVCVHAEILPTRKMLSYYSETVALWYKEALAKDTIVDVPGTGTVAYYSSLLNLNMDDFKNNYMADIWFYLICKRYNIPVIAIQRDANWILPGKCSNDSNALFSKYRNNDSLHTSIVNQHRGFV